LDQVVVELEVTEHLVMVQVLYKEALYFYNQDLIQLLLEEEDLEDQLLMEQIQHFQQ
jgi:hypothetical protein